MWVWKILFPKPQVSFNELQWEALLASIHKCPNRGLVWSLSWQVSASCPSSDRTHPLHSLHFQALLTLAMFFTMFHYQTCFCIILLLPLLIFFIFSCLQGRDAEISHPQVHQPTSPQQPGLSQGRKQWSSCEVSHAGAGTQTPEPPPAASQGPH